jgi:hypothetical protein
VGKISLVNESLSAKGLVFSGGETVNFKLSPDEAAAVGHNNNSFDSSTSHSSSSSSSSSSVIEGKNETITIAAAPSTQHGTGAPHWQALLELAEKAVAMDAATWAEWDLWELVQQQKQHAEITAKNAALAKNNDATTSDSALNNDAQADLPSLETFVPEGSSDVDSGSLHQPSSYPPPQGVLVRNCTAQELMQALGPALYRLCVSGCLQTVMPPKMEAFEPSESFLGHVPNHVFATGKFGTG